MKHNIAALMLLGLFALSGLAQDTAAGHPALFDPSLAKETAPASFRVKFETTKGDFTVLVNREWSPNGADRFYNLVKIGYYQKVAFFRVIEGFMAQFGIHGNPDVNKVWTEFGTPDDPNKGISNTTGTLVFAKKGIPNSRSTQLYINMANNRNLDAMGFTPIGQVEGDGMQVVLSLYSGYGEGMPRGRGPDQMQAIKRGNPYIQKFFPNLDMINKITIVE